MKATTKKRLKKTRIVLLSIFLCAVMGICALLIYNHCYHKHIDSLADSSVPPAALKNPDEWEVTFMDNFDTLDKTKWKIITFDDYGNARRGAYYTDDEDVIFIKDGQLHINTIWKKGKHGEGWYSGFLKTSQTLDNEYNEPGFVGFAQTDGYYEIRCMAPPAYGMWAAFWMMPESKTAFTDKDILNSAEDGIEIDIMEAPNWYQPIWSTKYSIQHALHADAFSSPVKKSLASSFRFVRNLYFNFHTFGVLIEDGTYTFYIDGIRSWKTRFEVNDVDMGKNLVPEYLILSNEVSGAVQDGVLYEGQYRDSNGKWVLPWAGTPNRNDKNRSYDFVIDYVRCYKKK